MIHQRWLAKWLNRYGEAFVAGGEDYRGIFSPASGDLLRLFYSSDQIGALNRPLWALCCLSTPALTTGTSLTWRGQIWVVLQRHELVFDSESLYQVALLSPSAA